VDDHRVKATMGDRCRRVTLECAMSFVVVVSTVPRGATRLLNWAVFVNHDVRRSG